MVLNISVCVLVAHLHRDQLDIASVSLPTCLPQVNGCKRFSNFVFRPLVFYAKLDRTISISSDGGGVDVVFPALRRIIYMYLAIKW